jgi:chemotaxis-related protein WspB
MLFLQFRLGQDSFALAADAIVEIVPLTALQATRATLAGDGVTSFDYRGRFIPAVDLCLRELGRPAHARLSTRIVVVRSGAGDLVGLIAEQATTMLRLDPEDFAPFARGPDGLVQRVMLEDLLPRSMVAA